MLKQIINAKNKLISETEQSSVTQCWEAFLFKKINVILLINAMTGNRNKNAILTGTFSYVIVDHQMEMKNQNKSIRMLKALALCPS